jgi:hypothetical protein
VLLAALLLASRPVRAADAAAPHDVREAVRQLKRLRQTCLEHNEDDDALAKLVNVLLLEGVRLYEGSQYEPALDSILLAGALGPDDAVRTHYGVQPRLVEVAVRWPNGDEAKLLPLDATEYRWAMVAVANVSGVRLDLRAMHAGILREGKPVAGADGKPITSLTGDDASMRRQLGVRARLLVPPAAEQGGSATFPVVFPAFGEWTAIRFVDPVNKIDLTVRNYPRTLRHLGRFLAARKLADERDKRIAKLRQKSRPPDPPKPRPKPNPRPEKPTQEWILVGLIRNEITSGQYGIDIREQRLLRTFRVRHFYVRIAGNTIATLKPIGRGSIAVVVRSTRRPLPKDLVFVRRDELKRRR